MDLHIQLSFKISRISNLEEDVNFLRETQRKQICIFTELSLISRIEKWRYNCQHKIEVIISVIIILISILWILEHVLSQTNSPVLTKNPRQGGHEDCISIFRIQPKSDSPESCKRSQNKLYQWDWNECWDRDIKASPCPLF